jgi:ATP-dependent Clp protease ATP-binding subunit ClpA
MAEATGERIMLDGFEPFNEASRRVLFYARWIVSELGGTTIEPEHSLLGLMRTQPAAVISTLAQRTSADDMIRELRGRVAQDEKVSKEVDIPFSEATEEVLVRAVEEARGLDTLVVRPEHMLLALLYGETAISSILREHGVEASSVRKHLPDRTN